MKALVVYYSRTGHMRRLGELIANELDAELEEITDRANRRGVLGYLRSGNEATFRRRTPIRRSAYDPSSFDVVIIGTPVWRTSVSSPVRTYLEDQAAVLPHVAFVCTMLGFGHRRVFRQMREVCGRSPLATLARSERQLASSDLREVVAMFADQLRGVHPALKRADEPRTKLGSLAAPAFAHSR